MPIHTFYLTLQHSLILLDLLSLHQFSGNGFQRQTFLSSNFPNCPRASATAALESQWTQLELNSKSNYPIIQ
jgi:hypothetical protein